MVLLLPVLTMSACALQAAPATDVTQLPPGVQSPVPDDGTSTDRAAVRASLVDALSALEDQLSPSADGTPLHDEADRSRRLRTVETRALATQDLAAVDHLTPVDRPFRSSRFEAIAWQGVAIRGDAAKVFVIGRSTYRYWDGTGRSTPPVQVKALLRRDPLSPHGWIVTARKAASHDQG